MPYSKEHAPGSPVRYTVFTPRPRWSERGLARGCASGPAKKNQKRNPAIKCWKVTCTPLFPSLSDIAQACLPAGPDKARHCESIAGRGARLRCKAAPSFAKPRQAAPSCATRRKANWILSSERNGAANGQIKRSEPGWGGATGPSSAKFARYIKKKYFAET